MARIMTRTMARAMARVTIRIEQEAFRTEAKRRRKPAFSRKGAGLGDYPVIIEKNPESSVPSFLFPLVLPDD